MTRKESIIKAKKHIEKKSDLVYDVAINHSQIFENVKYMSWFVLAVAAEINPEKFPKIKENA